MLIKQILDATTHMSEEMSRQIADARSMLVDALYTIMASKQDDDDGQSTASDRFGALLMLGVECTTLAVEVHEAVDMASLFDQTKFSSLARALLLTTHSTEDSSDGSLEWLR